MKQRLIIIALMTLDGSFGFRSGTRAVSRQRCREVPDKPKGEAPTRLPGRRTLVDTLDEKCPSMWGSVANFQASATEKLR